MDEKSTQVQSDEKLLNTLMNNEGASSKTLTFLKLLAHCYHIESSLPVALNATCTN